MPASSRPPEAARFAETQWNVVAAAAESRSPEAAEDLTQGFFAERVVTRRVLKDISPERGKFRS